MAGQTVTVVVSGNMRHGKDTLADMLAGMIPQSRRDSFAAPLKICVSLKTGIPMEILNGPGSVKEDARFGRYGKSPRQLMQEEGQEARERIGKTVWMDRAAERALHSPARVTIISDGRHPDEEIVQIAERVRSAGKDNHAFGVRIVRPGEPLKLGHPSEDKIAAVSDDIFDFKVVNDGDLSDLAKAARQLADAIILRAKGQAKRKLNGWVVRCPGGSERLPEPFTTKQDAEILSHQLMAPCASCASLEDHSVEPCAFDLITII